MVGKTSLLLRYIDGIFSNSDIATIGIDFKVKYVSFNDKKIKLDLWDTAGQERFKALSKNYFKGANGFIFVFDITSRESFESVKKWINEAKSNSSVKPYQMIISGNKSDMEDQREVSKEELHQLAEKHGAKGIETSAKSGENVEEMFVSLIEALSINSPVDTSTNKKLEPDHKPQKKFKC